MALQKLLSQLRHNVLGSSSAVRSVSTNGIWTSLRKSGMLQHTEDFHTLLSSAPPKHALQSDFHTLPSVGKRHAIITGDEMKKLTLGRATNIIYQSHVCLAIRQGATGDTLALLPGTIIRSDGIVATSASLFRSLNTKQLKETVDVMVLDTNETYKGVLLDVDLCSNIAFVKMLSGRQQKVAKLGKLDDLVPGSTAVAAGCHVRHGILRHAESHLSRGSFGSVANTRTSGRFIRAAFSQDARVVGGPLIHPHVGVLGVINSMGCQIKATPIDDVLKYLERLEKHGEQQPKSVACA